MDSIGFVFILPYLAVCGWIIVSTRRDLIDYAVTDRWWRAYWGAVVAGVPLGFWLAFGMQLRLPEMILHGMPVPRNFELLRDGVWVMNPPPALVRSAALVCDLISGPTLLLFLLKISALIKYFKKATRPQP